MGDFDFVLLYGNIHEGSYGKELVFALFSLVADTL